MGTSISNPYGKTSRANCLIQVPSMGLLCWNQVKEPVALAELLLAE